MLDEITSAESCEWLINHLSRIKEFGF